MSTLIFNQYCWDGSDTLVSVLYSHYIAPVYSHRSAQTPPSTSCLHAVLRIYQCSFPECKWSSIKQKRGGRGREKKKKRNHCIIQERIFIFVENENALLLTKVPIRPTKTGGSFCFCLWLVDDFFISLFTWMCTRFLCKTLLLYFPYL